MSNTHCPYSGKEEGPPQHMFPSYPACQSMSLEAPCLPSACGDKTPEVPLQLSCSRDPLLIPCPKKGQQPAHAIGGTYAGSVFSASHSRRHSPVGWRCRAKRSRSICSRSCFQRVYSARSRPVMESVISKVIFRPLNRPLPRPCQRKSHGESQLGGASCHTSPESISDQKDSPTHIHPYSNAPERAALCLTLGPS